MDRSRLLNLLIFTAVIIFVVAAFLVWRRRRRSAPQRVQTAEEFFAELTRSYKEELRRRPKMEFDIAKLGYNPLKAPCLERFKPCQNQTHCVFARQARLAGPRDWDNTKSLEENVLLNLDVFADFLKVGVTQHLDGFLFQVRGKGYCDTLDNFADTVRRVLWTLSENDPNEVRCMRKSYLDKKGWFFEFGGDSIFVTCFAPCYPVTHSRYQFEADPESCFILLQPEYSFTWHDLPLDTPHTNWDNPVTVRDKIRSDFRNANREYEIPPTVAYPPAHHIVPPMNIGDPIIDFWIPKEQRLKNRAEAAATPSPSSSSH